MRLQIQYVLVTEAKPVNHSDASNNGDTNISNDDSKNSDQKQQECQQKILIFWRFKIFKI
jgi:hypothetical protein